MTFILSRGLILTMLALYLAGCGYHVDVKCEEEGKKTTATNGGPTWNPWDPR